MTDWSQAPVRALAYMGDAVYEKHVRERTLRAGTTAILGGKQQALHQSTVGHVSAVGQAGLVERLLPHFTDEEAAVFRRGRNHKSATPRRVSGHHYRMSTAFEAVLGYLYLKPDTARLQALLALIDEFSASTSQPGQSLAIPIPSIKE